MMSMKFAESDIRKFAFLDDHLSYGMLPDSDRVFQVTVGEIKRRLKTPMEESKLAALQISMNAKKSGGDLVLLLSGGTDSHCMCQSFVNAKLDFSCVIFRFDDGKNDYDIKYAIDYCKKMNLNYSIKNVCAYNFFESGEVEYYQIKYKCASPQLALLLFCIDNVSGIPVMAGNPIYPFVNHSGEVRLHPPNEVEFSFLRYFLVNQRLGVSHFFLYSPELIHSFLQLEKYNFQDFTAIQTDQLRSYKGLHDFKTSVYRGGGFNFETRPQKYTGFEGLKKEFQRNYLWGECVPTFDNLYRYLNYTFWPPAKSNQICFH